MGWLNFDEDKQLQHPIIKKHKKILEKTGSKERVFTVMLNEDELSIMECCDECFVMKLEKQDCLELAALFEDLAEELGK